MKNKIPFGVSTSKVGAITVYNYRIRCTAYGIIEQLLRKVAFNTKYIVRSACDRYTIFDFSTTDAMEFASIARQIDRALLDAKIAKLNSRYNHLGTISFKDITMEKDYLDWNLEVVEI